MTRSARAKKAKRADFAKVKLKVGKRVKKAQNETRVEFKARRITIKEQLALKKEGEQLLTKKKRSVKDLVQCLGSTNTYVRQDGLNGMLELVRMNDTDALTHTLLAPIISGVAPCVFDVDSLIRSAALKLIEALLLKVGSASVVEPYFPVLASHLSCAMVHLNTGVQSDSLRLVNILVRLTPSLIASHAHTLINNFISLISRKTQSSGGGGGGGVRVDFRRILHTNPSSTLTTHTGHVGLLQELCGFLEVMVREHRQIHDRQPLTLWERVLVGSVAPTTTTTTTTAKDVHRLFTDSPQRAHTLISDIIPLLFQVWAEVDPKNVSAGRGDGGGDINNLLDEEGVKALTCIATVITHITTLTRLLSDAAATTTTSKQQQQQNQSEASLISQLASPFMSKIMPGFPYYTLNNNNNNNNNNKKRSKKSEGEQQECVIECCHHLNLTLAALAIQLDTPHAAAHLQQAAAPTFISRMFRDSTQDGEYKIECGVSITLHLLPRLSSQEGEAVVGSVLSCYHRLHPLKKDRPSLLKVLLAATHIDNQELWKCKSVEEWVSVLVEELSSMEVVMQVLEVANTLRLQNNTPINHLLTINKNRIEGNLRQRSVSGLSKSSLLQRLHTLFSQT